MGPESGAIDKAIEEVAKSGLDIEDKGNIKDYLGVNIEEKDNGKINLTQPHIIYIIINDVQLPKNTAPRQTPAVSNKILWRNAAAPPFDKHFNYRAVLGKIKFLEKSTRTDISYATHQCAHFSQDPRSSHGDTIIHLAKYLKAKRTQGIALDPKGNKSFEVYTESNFCGNWHCPTAGDDPRTAKSRTGYAILDTSCPIIWHINLNTYIALSMEEAEYIALSQSLRDAIPMMQLLR